VSFSKVGQPPLERPEILCVLILIAPSIFIQNEALSRETITTALSKSYKSGRSIVRRFVFDASDIASLKAKATSSSVQNPTRVRGCVGAPMEMHHDCLQGNFWYPTAILYNPCSEFPPKSKSTIHRIFHGKFTLVNRRIMHG
jgi:hypothetical protein